MAQNQRPQPTAEDKKNTRIGCGIMLAALLAVGGCNALINDDDDASSSSATSSRTYDDKATALEVGDFVGMDLQRAQDSAQAGGIYNLDSTDVSGQGRQQLLDRNWTVCAQTPAAGSTMSADDTLTFDTVKSSEGETCDAPAGAGSSEEPVTDDSATSGAEDPGSWDSSADEGWPTGADTGDASSGESSGSSSTSSTGGTSSAESGSGSSVTPDDPPKAPAGATAQCNDGTYSYSAHRRGTCSHHGGVAVWLASSPS